MVNDGPTAFDSTDRGALLSLVSQVVKWRGATDRLRKEIRALEAAEKEALDKWGKAIESFSLYGFEELNEPAWERIREIVGAEMWNAAIDKGTIQAAQAVMAAREQAVPATDNTGVLSEITTESGDVQDAATSISKPEIVVKDVVLAELRSAYPKAVKAAALREFIANSYQRNLHEKTVGMTLYRLLKEGLARREGRNWFAVPPREETENPGVDAPGNDYVA